MPMRHVAQAQDRGNWLRTAFARPSGKNTSPTAPAAKRNTITDSSSASNRDASAHPWSLHDSANEFTKYKI